VWATNGAHRPPMDAPYLPRVAREHIAATVLGRDDPSLFDG
jgi:hypothetical protein